MPNLTDLSTIRDVCARHDFALSKGFGQNFIINPGICPRIAEAAGIGPGWGALEVGPGIGVLTEQLCKRADKVVSIEVDKRLPPILAETMAEYENFKLVLEDVLKVDLRTLLAEEFGDKPVAVCANLPYYITSPILMRLLEEKLPIRNITVMVQKEAAQRLCAALARVRRGQSAMRWLITPNPSCCLLCSRAAFTLPQSDQRGHPAGCPHHTACYPAQRGRSRAVPPDPGSIFSAAQDRGQCRGERPGHFKAKVNAALQTAGLDIRLRPEQLTLEDYCALQAALAAAE